MKHYSRKTESAAEKGCAALLVIALLLPIYVLSTWALMWLWNSTVPPLFHGPHLTYWQTFALWVLVSVIGSNFRSAK